MGTSSPHTEAANPRPVMAFASLLFSGADTLSGKQELTWVPSATTFLLYDPTNLALLVALALALLAPALAPSVLVVALAPVESLAPVLAWVLVLLPPTTSDSLTGSATAFVVSVPLRLL